MAIVGSGFAGLAVAIELLKAGHEDLVLLERGTELGGTWRDNRYPGCACDVPSHLYSFSFASSGEWTRTFARSEEIHAYLKRVAHRFGIEPRIRYGWEAVSARWDATESAWRLRARSGEELLATSLVLGVGALSNPALPVIAGRERFEGGQLHSARWDPAYDFAGKRVVVIGTGASAIQFVPRLQRLAARLFVLQRTPPWVMSKPDRPFRAWERALLRLRPLRWAYRQWLYWSREVMIFAFADHPLLSRVVRFLSLRNMAKSIRDPALRAKLTPSYRPGCKRILMSNEYYPALAQPNVEVVTDGVAEVGTRTVTLASGRVLEADAIVYGTGFEVHNYLGGMAIRGREGTLLSESWTHGAEAYLGTVIAGFPNLFVMTGPNTGLGHNSMVIMIEAQARLVRQAILRIERGQSTLEVRPQTQVAFNQWVHARNARTVWSSGCRSWYLDARGRNTVLWPTSTVAFRARTKRLRTAEFVEVPRRALPGPTAAPWAAGEAVSGRVRGEDAP